MRKKALFAYFYSMVFIGEEKLCEVKSTTADFELDGRLLIARSPGPKPCFIVDQLHVQGGVLGLIQCINYPDTGRDQNTGEKSNNFGIGLYPLKSKKVA